MRLVVLLCLLACCLQPIPLSAQPVPSADESRLLALLNLERVRLGLAKFALDAHLIEAARAHSGRMAAHGGISHQFSEERDPSVRMAATGLRFSASAENVAVAGTVEQAHDGLLRSPGHYANIKNAAYNRIGIGIVRRGNRLYVTEDFAHGLVTFSDEQFRTALALSVNRQRRTGGRTEMMLTPEPWLHQAACAEKEDFKLLHQALPEAAELVVFTASEPDKLPAKFDRAAQNAALHRMSLGVCFRPGMRTGFGSFWVIAALYR